MGPWRLASCTCAYDISLERGPLDLWSHYLSRTSKQWPLPPPLCPLYIDGWHMFCGCNCMLIICASWVHCWYCTCLWMHCVVIHVCECIVSCWHMLCFCALLVYVCGCSWMLMTCLCGLCRISLGRRANCQMKEKFGASARRWTRSTRRSEASCSMPFRGHTGCPPSFLSPDCWIRTQPGRWR